MKNRNDVELSDDFVANEASKRLGDLINTNFKIQDAMTLVSLGADPNTKNSNGDSLLHILAKKENNPNGENDEYIYQLVTNFKAKINIQNGAGSTALQCLLESPSDIRGAMKLVCLGANPNDQDSNGNTLLHKLVNHNVDGINDKAIEDLVKKHGANINIENKQKFTPLQCLINRQYFDKEDAMKLVRLGADPNTRDYKGNFLLHIFAGCYDLYHKDISIVKELVSKFKANIYIQDSRARTLWEHSIKWAISLELTKLLAKHTEVNILEDLLKELKSGGSLEPGSISNCFTTYDAIVRTIQNELLIKKNPTKVSNVLGVRGQLLKAIEQFIALDVNNNNHDKIMQSFEDLDFLALSLLDIILKYDPGFNKERKKSVKDLIEVIRKTYLLCIIKNNNDLLNIIAKAKEKMCIKVFTIVDEINRVKLAEAGEQSTLTMSVMNFLSLSEDAMAYINKISVAPVTNKQLLDWAKAGEAKKLKPYLAGIDINHTLLNGESLIYAGVGSAKVLSLLIKKGAKLHDKSILIHYAIYAGSRDSVALLLDEGCNANTVMNPTQLTPLMLAAWEGRADIVSLLLGVKVDANQSTSCGTALTLAIEKKHLNIVRLLVPKMNLNLLIKEEKKAHDPVTKAILTCEIIIRQLRAEIPHPRIYENRQIIINRLCGLESNDNHFVENLKQRFNDLDMIAIDLLQSLTEYTVVFNGDRKKSYEELVAIVALAYERIASMSFSNNPISESVMIENIFCLVKQIDTVKHNVKEDKRQKYGPGVPSKLVSKLESCLYSDAARKYDDMRTFYKEFGWGDFEILVNALDTDQFACIESMLRHIKDHDLTKTVWFDNLLRDNLTRIIRTGNLDNLQRFLSLFGNRWNEKFFQKILFDILKPPRFSDCLKMFKHLLPYCGELNTDVNIRNARGKTLLYQAVHYPEVIEFLCNNKQANLNILIQSDMLTKGGTVLHNAARSGCKESVAVLLRAGCQIDAVNFMDGYTPLMLAIAANQYAVVELLINGKANINAKCVYRDLDVEEVEITPLSLALSLQDEAILKLLLRQPNLKLTEAIKELPSNALYRSEYYFRELNGKVSQFKDLSQARTAVMNTLSPINSGLSNCFYKFDILATHLIHCAATFPYGFNGNRKKQIDELIESIVDRYIDCSKNIEALDEARITTFYKEITEKAKNVANAAEIDNVVNKLYSTGSDFAKEINLVLSCYVKSSNESTVLGSNDNSTNEPSTPLEELDRLMLILKDKLPKHWQLVFENCQNPSIELPPSKNPSKFSIFNHKVEYEGLRRIMLEINNLKAKLSSDHNISSLEMHAALKRIIEDSIAYISKNNTPRLGQSIINGLQAFIVINLDSSLTRISHDGANLPNYMAPTLSRKNDNEGL